MKASGSKGSHLCPVCQGPSDYLHALYDDRFGYPSQFKLFCCRACKHKSLAAEFSEKELSELYTSYYPRAFLPLERFRPRDEVSGFRAWLNGDRRYAYSWVPKNVAILDVGCGFGETLAYHESLGCRVYCVEADENIRRVAEHYRFNVHVGLFDPDLYETSFFDYVTLDQVVEHLRDFDQIFKGIARILKPGGWLVISTPNSNGLGARLFRSRWLHWHAPYHLEHFSARSMRQTAGKAGLVVEMVRTITSSHWLDWQWKHLATFPDVGEPSAFWSPQRQTQGMNAVLLGALTVAHKLKINHFLTRVLDTLGLGDNYLFLIRKH